jgi:hypothetical protein
VEHKIVEPHGQSPWFLINGPVRRHPPLAPGQKPAGFWVPGEKSRPLANYFPSLSFFQPEKKAQNLSEVPGGRLRK